MEEKIERKTLDPKIRDEKGSEEKGKVGLITGCDELSAHAETKTNGGERKTARERK